MKVDSVVLHASSKKCPIFFPLSVFKPSDVMMLTTKAARVTIQFRRETRLEGAELRRLGRMSAVDLLRRSSIESVPWQLLAGGCGHVTAAIRRGSSVEAGEEVTGTLRSIHDPDPGKPGPRIVQRTWE